MNLRKLQKLYERTIKGVLPTKTARFLVAVLLSFTLVVTWGGAAWGQIPFLNLEAAGSDRPIVDFFNRPYRCGNLVCSNVWFNGLPILEIASEPVSEEDEESGFSAEVRAKRIQNTLQDIFKGSLASSNYSSSSGIGSQRAKEIILPNQITRKNENSTPTINPKKIHPNLPDIQVGTLNNETVVYVPEKPESPNRKILTITTADVLHTGIPTEDLAERWRELVRFQLNKALTERDRLARYPLENLKTVLVLLLVMVLLSTILAYAQKKLGESYKTIRKELRELEASIAVDPESVSGENNDSRKFLFNNIPIAFLLLRKVHTMAGILFLQELSISSKEVPEAQMPYPKDGSAKSGGLEYFWRNLPKFSLKKQSFLKKQINILLLVLQSLLWMQALIWLCGTALTLSFYPNTRAIGFLLIIKTFPIVGLWLLVTILDKISHFAIDFNLNKWAQSAQFTDEFSQRYALRVSTYSAALNNFSSVIFWLIGIISTAEILGIATSVLASAGVMVAAITYFSQNLVRDAINGLLILLTDRYAVGDVILVDDVGGFVERMNLYMTHLRSADGEYITIPNGSINVVRNITKDWSRVNFTIEVAYDADIKRALQVLREVSKQMYDEPEWRENLVEPIDVLGIDEVSHAGMLIRVWLKTQPLKQWLVGREFRLRVKEAFDREGITIGIPQRSLSVKNYSGFPNINGKSKKAIDN